MIDNPSQMSSKILWIEGGSNNSPSFVPGLRRRGYLVESVPTGKVALAHIPALLPDLAVVHAASLRTSGRRICQTLRVILNGHPVVLIINPSQQHGGKNWATQTLVLPFTIRKLVNHIKALIPGESHTVIQAGPLSLYPDLQVVRRDGGEPQRLTPHLMSLLQILMKHPGEALHRERIFRLVWQTDYVADTRTLDVHISWLRKKIEADHRSPQILKTVRGVGYRLDV